MINKDLILDQNFSQCEKCKNTQGFNVVIQRVEERGERNAKIKLKCPKCGELYDLGLRATLEKDIDEEEIEDINTENMEFEEL